MSKKIIYEENPFGDIKLGRKVFLPELPTPTELAARDKNTKITISVSDRSLRFFKKTGCKAQGSLPGDDPPLA